MEDIAAIEDHLALVVVPTHSNSNRNRNDSNLNEDDSSDWQLRYFVLYKHRKLSYYNYNTMTQYLTEKRFNKTANMKQQEGKTKLV